MKISAPHGKVRSKINISLLTGFVSVVPFVAPSCPLDAEVIEATLTHDNRERDYLVHVPSSYDAEKPMPLVLSIHGLGQDGETQMRASRMNEVSMCDVLPNLRLNYCLTDCVTHSASPQRRFLSSSEYRIIHSTIVHRPSRIGCGQMNR